MNKILISIVFIVYVLAQDSKLDNSVYIGAGTFTNIGGAFGFGVELEIFDSITLNAALGTLYPHLTEETQFSKLGYDFGIKYYLRKQFFLGLNYGQINYKRRWRIINN